MEGEGGECEAGRAVCTFLFCFEGAAVAEIRLLSLLSLSARGLFGMGGEEGARGSQKGGGGEGVSGSGAEVRGGPGGSGERSGGQGGGALGPGEDAWPGVFEGLLSSGEEAGSRRAVFCALEYLGLMVPEGNAAGQGALRVLGEALGVDVADVAQQRAYSVAPCELSEVLEAGLRSMAVTHGQAPPPGVLGRGEERRYMRVNELLEQGEAGSAMAQRLLEATVEQLKGTEYFEGEPEGSGRYAELLADVEREFEASFVMRTETAREAAKAALDSGALSVACSAAAAAAAAAMGAGADRASSLEAGAAAAREVDAELRLMGDEHHLLGTRSYRDGNAQAAADRFTAAAATVPGHPGHLESRATALNALGRHAEAEQDCRLAIQAGPRGGHALAQLGHALVGQGRFRAAVEEGFKLSIKVDPQEADYVRPHMAIAESLAQQAARLPPGVDPVTLVVGAKRRHAHIQPPQQHLIRTQGPPGGGVGTVAGAVGMAGGNGQAARAKAKGKAPKTPPRGGVLPGVPQPHNGLPGGMVPGMYAGVVHPSEPVLEDKECPVPIPTVIPKVNKDWKNKVYPRRKPPPKTASPPLQAGLEANGNGAPTSVMDHAQQAPQHVPGGNGVGQAPPPAADAVPPPAVSPLAPENGAKPEAEAEPAPAMITT